MFDFEKRFREELVKEDFLKTIDEQTKRIEELEKQLSKAIIPKFKIGKIVCYYDVDIKNNVKAKVTGYRYDEGDEFLFYELYGISRFVPYKIIAEDKIFLDGVIKDE